MVPVAVARYFSEEKTVLYIVYCTSVVDDVIFSQWGQWGRIFDDVVFGRVRQEAEPIGDQAARTGGEGCYSRLFCPCFVAVFVINDHNIQSACPTTDL